MTRLPLDIAEKLIDACKAGAGDASGLLSTALDNKMQIADVVAGDPIAAGGLPDELSGPGLAISLQTGEESIALLLPEATNLLPVWYSEPDPTGESNLQSLAQELSKLLLPEEIAIDKFAAGAVGDLSEAAATAALADPAGCLQLRMTGDDGKGAFFLLWPLSRPAALLPIAESASTDAQSTTVPTSETPAGEAAQANGEPQVLGVDHLPSYSRSLLNVKVPVIVTLAQTKMAVDDVLHLGPGAIIQFTKSCEEALDLEAGEHKIAEGEAVKVGDKFGLRITSIRLPEERYKAVGT